MTDRLDGASVLVLQHLAVEDPGSIGDILMEAGMLMTVVELDEGEGIPPLHDFDLMLVMGGPMDVWQEERHPWLISEKAAIRHWVRGLRRPYLGVCLGHQLLADASGGAVGPMPTPEVGVMEIALTASSSVDPVFARLSSAVHGLQWHGAQIVGLPPDGVVLATNSHCAIQAIRVGPCAWGVQFHLEVGDSTVAEWMRVPEYLAALEDLGGGDADWLKEEVALQLGSLQVSARVLVSGVLDAVTASMSRIA